MKKNPRIFIGLWALLLLAAVILSLWAGGFPQGDVADVIFWQIRLPRVVLAALVGASLAVAGAVFQGVLRNPLADPYILGVSSGAGLGAALALVLGWAFWAWGISSVSLLALAGALIASFLVYRLSLVSGTSRVTTLILAGVALSAFLSSALALLVIISGRIWPVQLWLMGNLTDVSWEKVMLCAPYFLIGAVLAFIFARRLDIMVLGEDEAAALGAGGERPKIFFLVIGTVLAAASASVAGLIGFVGLLTPHIVRRLSGALHRQLIVNSALAGAFIMVLADLLARTVLAPQELPVGLVTAFLGAPFFLYLLRREKFDA